MVLVLLFIHVTSIRDFRARISQFRPLPLPPFLPPYHLLSPTTAWVIPVVSVVHSDLTSLTLYSLFTITSFSLSLSHSFSPFSLFSLLHLLSLFYHCWMDLLLANIFSKDWFSPTLVYLDRLCHVLAACTCLAHKCAVSVLDRVAVQDAEDKRSVSS